MSNFIRELDYEIYFDKVYGGWLGKCIGGAVGAQVEGRKQKFNFTEENVFPEKWPPNDDLDLQVLWLHAIEKRGIYLTSKDLAEEWIEHCWYYFNEYGRFLKNYARGIEPPVSGWFDNDYFKESMGSPIRSEIWGFICPGNPELAADYAERDAVLDHSQGSVWAEQFYAAIEAEVFFEDRIETLLQQGLNFVPARSKLWKLAQLVINCRENGLSWEEARLEVLRRFGSPDATSVYQNVGFTLIALLWGEKDFSKTVLTALNCGYDTDCTCATAGAILGAILGEGGIPEKWKAKIKDVFEMGFSLPRESCRLSDLSRETCTVGVAISGALNKKIHVLSIPGEVRGLAKRIPLGRPASKVEIDVNYLGLPTIGKGEEKEIEIVVKNNDVTSLSGFLRLEVPDNWVSQPPTPVKVPAREVRAYRLKLKAPSSGVLWDRNILQAVLTSDAGESWKKNFGLCGAKLWWLRGPFWDSPDWIHDAADIDKQYVDEQKMAANPEEFFKGGLEFSSPGSRLPLEKVLGFKGESCCYLLRKVYAPYSKQIAIVIGSSGEVKVWLNGHVLGDGRSKGYIWNPLMYWFPARLGKGVNTLIVKYVKKTLKPKLSIDIYAENSEKAPGYSVWQVDLGSVLD